MSGPEPTTDALGSTAATTAVIVAAGEETRVLLRGLLRLQHFHVVGEAEGSTDGVELVRQHLPGLVLIDASLAEGSASSFLRSARALVPRARLVVLGTLDREGAPVGEGTADAVLRKPFRIAEFSAAIGRDAPSNAGRPD